MIEPRPFKRKDTDCLIAIIDSETDPFDYDEKGDPIIVAPFCIGFYVTGFDYVDFWGDDCVEQFFRHMHAKHRTHKLMVYAHNGGRFDFMFFLDYLSPDHSPFIIDGRIVSATFDGQEFRDSYKIMPFPLKDYKKTKIDYRKFRRECREEHKAEIRKYQRDDVFDLLDLVNGFHEMFGDRITIASTSLPMLNSYHGFELMSEVQDTQFRKFYFGGRVEVFKGGICRTPFEVFDVNSMYPYVMKTYRHPVGNRPHLSTQIGPDTFLLCLMAQNNGALCQKADDGSLSFACKEGEFFCTIHEYRAGLKTGTLHPKMIKHCWDFDEWASFDTFVDTYYDLRAEAKARGDKIRALLYKYLLNSSYGKFAQDPRDYEEFLVNYGDIPNDDQGWPDHFHETENPNGWKTHSTRGQYFVWSRPSKSRWRSFKNVATGASITGAARAELLLGISRTRNPLYCDTDSVICGGFSGDTDGSRLGAWKSEAKGVLAAIAGKKLYALFDTQPPAEPVDEEDDGVIDDPKLGRLYCVKKASKGAHLTAAQIVEVARGGEIEYVNPVPLFKMDGSIEVTRRTIRRTIAA